VGSEISTTLSPLFPSQKKKERKEKKQQEKKDKKDKKDKKESQQPKKLTLTPILPIIFYHGTQEWKVPLGFHDIFLDLPSLLAPYVPSFRYFLATQAWRYDLTTVKDSEI